jgi:hypothetical protein
MKTPEGESKQILLGNGADGEEYVKHLMSFECYLEKLGYEADLEAASTVTLIAYQSLKKANKVQPGEKETAKRLRKKSLKKPRSPRAPAHAWLMISFVNCYETIQKHNGIKSCPRCTLEILGRI